MKVERKNGKPYRKVAALASVALVAALAIAPAVNGGASEPEYDLDAMGYAKFTEVDAGDYPDVDPDIVNYINDGARGCNACHEDIWEVVDSVRQGELKEHMATSAPGYGRNATWTDCFGCHNGNDTAGKTLKDQLHIAHYSSEFFVDVLDGNCFSCHAINKNGQFVMWDFYRHSAEFGGFTAGGSLNDQIWVAGRSYLTDTAAGVNVQADMPMTNATFYNEPTTMDNRFVAVNFGVREIAEEDYELNVTGVKNPRTFTLEELKALPQVERTVGAYCFANSVGSYQASNVTMKGVLLADIIEACGGLEDGIQSLLHVGSDGWAMPAMAFGMGVPGGLDPANYAMGWDIDFLLGCGAMLVFEEGGQPLTAENGYPAAFVMPGAPAGMWTKYCTEFKFLETPGVYGATQDVFFASYNDSPMTDLSNPAVSTNFGFFVNAGFWNPINEGDVLQIEDGVVHLKGFAYNWNSNHENADCFVDKISFTSDYGNTWTEVAVPTTGLDPYQLITWEVDWEVDEPGTYVLYVMAHSDLLGWQKMPAAITVQVVG